MSGIKKKTINGLSWSLIDNMAGKAVTFVIGIILARLLSPKEFGLIGMITVFIAVSHSFIDSGFSQALIRKNKCSDEDYSTVFYFNLIVGVIFFFVLFFSAPFISLFFKEPQLLNLIKVLGIVVIIDGLTIIQVTILTKRIDFKLQAKISFASNILSGIIGVTMAYNGFGAWSLIAQVIAKSSFNSLFLWIWNNWRPLLVFNKNSFKELYAFGYKLLISGLISTIYKNIYYLVIGKFFSAESLGFYTRADQFKDLPSTNITSVIQRVSYPVLAQMQDDPVKLKMGYKKLITSTMLISFVLMFGMAAVAEPLIITLIGEKWRVSVLYLQMICFVGMMYPLHALNLNMLNVKGRSDLFLKLEIIKKTLSVPVIVLGVVYGMKIMLLGMIVNTQVAFVLNSYWSGKLINYPMKEQVKDILPSFFIAIFSATIVFLIGWVLPLGYHFKLIIQFIMGAILVIASCELSQLEAYLSMKEIIISQLKKN